jgi:hypothetical protein
MDNNCASFSPAPFDISANAKARHKGYIKQMQVRKAELYTSDILYVKLVSSDVSYGEAFLDLFSLLVII